MKRLTFNALSLWQFEKLLAQPSVRHFVSDRNSAGGLKNFTLSFSSSPNKDEIRANRRAVAESMCVPDDHLFFPSQVHKARIVHVDKKIAKEDLMETDALVTNERGLCIAVMSADCVPILLYDKKNQAIGAVHAGWRGTVAKILDKTLNEMHKRFGTKGKDLIAGIGPSVCQESYEVGEEVVAEVNNAFGREQALLIMQPNGKAQLDLWQANKIQLLEFGVPSENIEISDLCTVKNNQHFFSARKGDSGRFAAGIVVV